MMVPQAWENDPRISEGLRAFYRYHSTLMEPWDGPAAVTFTDGARIGAVIDRNGLRPGRWLVTEDDLVVLASETGVIDVPEDRVRAKGRLEPGVMFLVDLEAGRLVPDSEIKAGLADAGPWAQWLEEGLVSLEDLPEREHVDHSQCRHTRTRVGLLVEAGDVREVHHVAALIGYGASAVAPYLAMESVEDMARAGRLGATTPEEAVAHLRKALGKGVLKVMSKMGISTVSSYCGAQVFQAIGLAQDFVDDYFTGTPSPLGGVGIGVGGEYKWRREGEEHLFSPETIARLQTATRTGSREVFREYAEGVDDQSKRLMTLRGLMRFRTDEVAPVPLEEVEPVSEIVTRFATGAMSFGSISREAHETMAIAMNALGARSNSGEGGEAPERLRDPLRNSAIKQVASGRFGVTADYLSHAKDIQIKMAQGAKPGEGGQLPAAKVYPWVAKERHSTPGVGLISPPPHHDIYSIEDLKQLISDLKNSDPEARVHVKLVSEVGVGTVAAGVAKARADVVLISGADGGTGTAPLTSLKHAGAPWELGVAEAQQTLVLGDLRDRVVLQADGQLKTGRDVVVAALLGAEEFGFATAPLVVSGCVMMRVCQKDTCPVGVATQNPELRERFTGKPEYVVNFFTYIAEQFREILASLGLRSIDEAVGRVDLLDVREDVDHWKASGLDIAPILQRIEPAPGSSLHHVRAQEHGLESVLDRRLIRLASPALENGEPVLIESEITNTDRTTGTMLGHEIALRHGDHGFAKDSIRIRLTGSAGAVARRVPSAGGDDPRRGRRQRLRREVPVRRHDLDRALASRSLRRRLEHDRGQRPRIRGDLGRVLRLRARRRALRRPQLRRDPRRGGERRSRPRIHDRRRGPHHRTDRQEHRGRNVRRRRLPPRPRPFAHERAGRPVPVLHRSRGRGRRARRGPAPQAPRAHGLRCCRRPPRGSGGLPRPIHPHRTRSLRQGRPTPGRGRRRRCPARGRGTVATDPGGVQWLIPRGFSPSASAGSPSTGPSPSASGITPRSTGSSRSRS